MDRCWIRWPLSADRRILVYLHHSFWCFADAEHAQRGNLERFVNRVYANLMRQRYAFFTENRTANLSESFNRVLNRISTAVISPLITIAGNLLSVVVLLVGVNIILAGKPC